MTSRFVRTIRLAILTSGVIALVAPLASATPFTIDFSTVAAPGDFGSDIFIDDTTGLEAHGLYFTGSMWSPAHLYVRDQTNDHGFGVCNPNESPCPGPNGGGNINELDNKGKDELIRLVLPDGYEWVSVQLSSLDDNDGEAFELGRLWADSDDNPANGLGTVLWEFKGDGPVEPSFAITGLAVSAPYLFFEPFDWENEGDNKNNDFLVYAATITQTETTPEPGSLVLLGAGLMALGLLRRRR